MLKLFENKTLKPVADLRAELDAAKARERELQQQAEAERVPPAERKLAKLKAEREQLEQQLAKGEREAAEAERTEVKQRYDAARQKLALSIMASAAANAALEEIEQEANALHRGLLFTRAGSLRELSIARRGRFMMWLRDLTAEGVAPQEVAPMLDAVSWTTVQRKDTPSVDAWAAYTRRQDADLSAAAIFDFSGQSPEQMRKAKATLAKLGADRACRLCAAEGRVREGRARTRNGQFGPESIGIRCDEHARVQFAA